MLASLSGGLRPQRNMRRGLSTSWSDLNIERRLSELGTQALVGTGDVVLLLGMRHIRLRVSNGPTVAEHCQCFNLPESLSALSRDLAGPHIDTVMTPGFSWGLLGTTEVGPVAEQGS
jgi:hypothetical protein